MGYDNDKMKTYLREYLLTLAEKKSNKLAIDKCKELLTSSNNAQKKVGVEKIAPVFRGELAEVLLELFIREYVNDNKNSFYVKGLCFEKPDKDGEFTEMDITLFTPSKILLFESKSYSQYKVLKDECTIYRKGLPPFNVYGQNKMHLENFDRYIRKCLNGKRDSKEIYKLCFWNYSLDETKDMREEEWKKKIPQITEDNIMKFLEVVSNDGSNNWNILKLYEVVSKLNIESEKNFKKHLKNMKSRRK